MIYKVNSTCTFRNFCFWYDEKTVKQSFPLTICSWWVLGVFTISFLVEMYLQYPTTRRHPGLLTWCSSYGILLWHCATSSGDLVWTLRVRFIWVTMFSRVLSLTFFTGGIWFMTSSQIIHKQTAFNLYHWKRDLKTRK